MRMARRICSESSMSMKRRNGMPLERVGDLI